jgi:hypothetical protein
MNIGKVKVVGINLYGDGWMMLLFGSKPDAKEDFRIAAEIARRCNAHEALVEGLKNACERLKSFDSCSCYGIRYLGGDYDCTRCRLVKTWSGALKAAGAELEDKK